MKLLSPTQGASGRPRVLLSPLTNVTGGLIPSFTKAPNSAPLSYYNSSFASSNGAQEGNNFMFFEGSNGQPNWHELLYAVSQMCLGIFVLIIGLGFSIRSKGGK
jgi:hypothetical protein